MIGTSEAAAQMGIVAQRDDVRSPADDLPRAYAPDNSTQTRSSAAARSAARRNSDAGAAMQGVSAAQPDTNQRFAEVTTTGFPAAEGGSPSASVGAAMSGAVIIATLIGTDTAQAGDIVSRGRSPVFALCRVLLAAGANPNSKLECFRGSVLALTVKTIGIGAKLTIKENDWVGPKVVPYEPFSRDRVGRHARQNDDPAPSPPLLDNSLAGGMAVKTSTTPKCPVQERKGG